MSTIDAEPFDWWQPFTTGDMFKAPQQGQPSMTQLDAERPPLEGHAEQVARHAQDLTHRAPTPKETAAAIEQAEALRDWIHKTWDGSLTGPEFYTELENRTYEVGLLALWWGLSGDMAALREFLQFMSEWQDRAGPDAIAAMTRAARRESAEWHVVAQAIGNMESQAAALHSPRLRLAAQAMRGMLAPDKLRPEAPAKAARQEAGQKAASARHNRTQELRARILAAMDKMPGSMSKNQKAQQVAPLALKLNKEAGHPFNWMDERQAEEYAREQLKPSKKRGAIRA